MLPLLLAAFAVPGCRRNKASLSPADEMFADGNRLFRDELVLGGAAALRAGLRSRYEFSSAALQHRCRPTTAPEQHERARAALLLAAAQSASLRVAYTLQPRPECHMLRVIQIEALEWFYHGPRPGSRTDEIRKLARDRHRASRERRRLKPIEDRISSGRRSALPKGSTYNFRSERVSLATAATTTSTVHLGEAYIRTLAMPTFPVVTPEVYLRCVCTGRSYA